MKRHHHITLLVFAISVTAVVYGLFWFMYYSVGNSLDHAVAAKEEAQKQQFYKDQGKELEALYESTAEDRSKLPTFFVPDSDKVVFIEKLESLGGPTGSKVTLSSITADDLANSPVGTQGHVIAHLDVEGSWSSVMRTLIYAENLQYKSSVNGIHLSVSTEGDVKSPKQVWHLTFVLDTLSIRTAN